MHERRFHGEPDRLRNPQRVALMEVDRAADLALDGLQAETALDVGTGSGLFAEAFARHGLAVSGVDANPDMLPAAQKYVPLGDFRPGTAEKLPFADAAFDLVFLGHVLHETDRPLEALKKPAGFHAGGSQSMNGLTWTSHPARPWRTAFHRPKWKPWPGRPVSPRSSMCSWITW